MTFKPGVDGLDVRLATPEDSALILDFINQLAVYEKMADDVVATEDGIRYWLFEQNKAATLLAYYNGEPVAFALFFYTFSTFLGCANLYLEDLFVKEQFRKLGIGKAMFRCLAQVARANGCRRMEWQCLDWNQNARDFYEGLGAYARDGWVVYHLPEQNLKGLAGE